MMMITYWWINI